METGERHPQPEAETPRPPARRRGGCFRTGCLGCLAVGGIGVALVAIMLLVAVVQGAPEKNPESTRLSRVLPGSGEAAPDVPLDDIGSGTEAGREGPEIEGTVAPPPPRPGRIVLDLSMGSFEVVPGPAGEPIRVEADYDAGTYELREELEPDGENGWVYSLSFGSKVSLFRQLLAGTDRPDPGGNRIRLIVPRDVPVAVTGRIGVGESDIQLGGLWLTDVALKMSVGEHKVDFKEPTREPVESIDVAMSLGEFGVRRIGNASPRRVRISQTIGEARYDLRGAWQRDAQVKLSCGIGECWVNLPDEDVALDVDRAALMIGESSTRAVDRRPPPPPGAPTVTLDVSQTVGEMRLSD